MKVFELKAGEKAIERKPKYDVPDAIGVGILRLNEGRHFRQSLPVLAKRKLSDCCGPEVLIVFVDCGKNCAGESIAGWHVSPLPPGHESLQPFRLAA